MACEGPPHKTCQETNPKNIKLRNGDLMLCDACNAIRFPSNNERSSRAKTNDDNKTPNDATALPSDQSVKRKIIIQPLLCYIVSGMNSGSTHNVKNAVIGAFTQEEIIEAKNTLSDKCVDQKKYHR